MAVGEAAGILPKSVFAEAPAGPRLAVVQVSAKPSRLELLSVNQRGGDPVRLAGGGARSRPVVDYFLPPSWAPDGGTIAFSGSVGFRGGDDREAVRRLFTVRADGSGLRAIPGTEGGLGPVVAPDGRTVAFARNIDRETPTTVGGRRWEEFHGSSIWTVDLQTGAQRQLTPWRDGFNYLASSFSPDGSTLLATYEDDLYLDEPQPVLLGLDGGRARRLYDDGMYPIYSPDGSRVALVRRIEEYGDDGGENTDLFIVNADGTGLRRLTRTPGRPELWPSWDPSGERLAYVRLALTRSEETPFGSGSALMQINADGTCQSRVGPPRRTLLFVPSWQPGPERGAGRIAC